MKLTTLIRIIVTLALVYGVYTETGKWTAISILIIFAGFEGAGMLVKKIGKDIQKGLKDDKLRMDLIQKGLRKDLCQK